MIISTPRTERTRPAARVRRGAFTLPEVMISATLSVLVMAGVLSAFLFFGRTGLATAMLRRRR